MTEEPLIITLIKQRLDKGELIKYDSMWGMETAVSGISFRPATTESISDRWKINLKSGTSVVIFDKNADNFDLIKHTGADGSFYWKLRNNTQNPVKESSDLPDIIDMIEVLLKKGEKVYTDGSGEQITRVERHGAGGVTLFFKIDDDRGTWTGSVVHGSYTVNNELDLEKRADGWHVVRHHARTFEAAEETKDEPLIVSLMRQRMKKGEPVFLGLGTYKYFLRTIEHVPGSAFSGGEEYWKLSFSSTPASLPTIRRVNFNSDAFWHLEKHVVDGKTMWNAWTEHVA